MPKATEVATLVVNGKLFEDWETFLVQTRYAEPYSMFRFTCAEREPMPPDWTKLQFKPGDRCQIKLAGQVAVTGHITTRQIAADAENHSTLLIGKGATWYPAKSSVKTETGSFDGFNFEQIARKVLAPYGISPETVGVLNARPFVACQNQPGESCWEFLERLARPRGIGMAGNEFGKWLLIDDHTNPVVQSLVEGVNILRIQCNISVDDLYLEYTVRGQCTATDERHGTAASEQEKSTGGTDNQYSNHLVPAEQPVTGEDEIQERCMNEAEWHEGTIIQATVTVQGWLKSDGTLWRILENVHVKSPMAMLDMILTVAGVTFTQDRQSGSLTVLELWVPYLVKDRADWSGVGNSGVIRPPNQAPPITPKAEPPPVKPIDPEAFSGF